MEALVVVCLVAFGLFFLWILVLLGVTLLGAIKEEERRGAVIIFILIIIAIILAAALSFGGGR
jgi:hypothetical protein